MTDTAEQLRQRHHRLLFGVRRSVRYHNRRRMFFDRCHVVTSFLGVIFGSATFLSILAGAGSGYALAAAAIVTLSSAIDLVVGTVKMARLHADLARQFISLEKALIPEESFSRLDELETQRLEIEAGEPPPLRVLDSMCHNELARALGYPSSEFKGIRWYQRLLAQFMDIQEHKIA